MNRVQQNARLTALLLVVSFCTNAEIADSITSRLDSLKEDTSRIRLLQSLCWQTFRTNPDQAIEYGQLSIEQVEKMKMGRSKLSTRESEIAANAFNALAVANATKGEYIDALVQFRNALNHFKIAAKERGIATTHNNIGLVHYYQGDYPKALEQFLIALEMNQRLYDAQPEKKSNRSGMSMVHNNLGMLYWSEGQHETALEYYGRALESYKILRDERGLSKCYNNMGIIYNEQLRYSQALAYHFKALELRKKNDDRIGIAFSYGNIGLNYQMIGEQASADSASTHYFPLALEYQLRSIEIREEINDQLGLSIGYKNAGTAYISLNDYDRALIYMERSREMSETIGDKEGLKFAYNGLAGIYEGLGDHENALNNYKLYTQMKDSLFNESKSQEIGRLEAKFEFEKAAEEQLRMENEKMEIERAKRARRDGLQYSGILVFVLFLFAMVFMSGRFRMSDRVAEGLVFFTFLLFFEFCLVLLDPYIDDWSSGEPVYKLGFNAILAGAIFPLHTFFESYMKKKIA